MATRIQLYRGDDCEYHHSVPFTPLVLQSMARIIGKSLETCYLEVIVLQVPEHEPAFENPSVENLNPDFGYTYVRIYDDEGIIYQHPHPLHEVVTDSLHESLRRDYPEEQHWFFRVDLPDLPRYSSREKTEDRDYNRPAPRNRGTIEIEGYQPGKGPAFSIKRLPEQEPPLASLSDYTLDQGGEGDGPVRVLVAGELWEDFHNKRDLSEKYEEGGFLLGRVFRDRDREGGHLLELTRAPEARYTGASLLHLTFTGDSFVHIKQLLRRQWPSERLLGWFHTHLFPATDDFGLSSIDVDLHFSTFTIPWQVAGLINLEKEGRTLRFYVRQGREMVLCPHWVMR